MTDKRFTLTTTKFDGTLSFYDAKYDCETRMSTEYVLDKVEITLNALYEENQILKSENNMLRTIKEVIALLSNLNDENEQLKKQTKKDKLNEAIQTIDKMITTQEQYEAWSIIYEKLIGKPLSYRLKR